MINVFNKIVQLSFSYYHYLINAVNITCFNASYLTSLTLATHFLAFKVLLYSAPRVRWSMPSAL